MPTVPGLPTPEEPSGPQACVLCHIDNAEAEVHEEARWDSRGDFVVEGWFVDKENASEEESWRLRVASDQADKLEATLVVALRRAGRGSEHLPGKAVEVLSDIQEFHWSGGVPGAVRFRMWLDGTDIAYEWKLEAVKDHRDQCFQKGPEPITLLPDRPGQMGTPVAGSQSQ